MKKLALALVASLIMFSSCSKKADRDGTHTHEDGSAHKDHADTTKREEFNASDSTIQDSTQHGHSHDH